MCSNQKFLEMYKNQDWNFRRKHLIDKIEDLVKCIEYNDMDTIFLHRKTISLLNEVKALIE